MTTEKERLQEIARKGADARRELHDIETEEATKKNAGLVGKCFKYSNSYGGGSERWWLYSEILGVDGNYFKTLAFQECEYGTITIETKECSGGHLQEVEITKRVFDAQFRLLLDKLEDIYQGGNP